MVGILVNLNELAKDSSNQDVIAECSKELEAFVENNLTIFNFTDFKENDYYKMILDFSSLIISGHELAIKLLNVMRLLSRDKKLVTNMEDVSIPMKLFSSLYEKECTVDSKEYSCKIEILKCLCNWAYHSKAVRDYIIAHNMMQPMIKQVKTSQIDDHVFFQIRLIFLISAMEASERAKMLENGALNSLLSIIEEGLKKHVDSSMKAEVEKSLAEVLKALFNITFELSNVTSEHVQNDYKRLASLSRKMLYQLYPFDHLDYNELFTHIVNVFLNFPKDALTLLAPPIDTEGNDSTIASIPQSKYPTIYQGHDMTAVIIMLHALEKRIVIEDYTLMKEKTFTVLSVFSYICRINCVIRKYLKEQILPRIKTSSVRPEEQTGLRGKIIRLMQTVDIPLKNMAADLLFVLCKENTVRLIKYTGYGNSAGFLASRGMMLPGIPYSVEGEYSTDEDSGGEEDDNIDIITGATAQPKEDIFANLSEQEKEQEIDNLISMTNRLKELNVIKPMAVKEDGKLVPVDEIVPNSDDSDSS